MNNVPTALLTASELAEREDRIALLHRKLNEKESEIAELKKSIHGRRNIVCAHCKLPFDGPAQYGVGEDVVCSKECYDYFRRAIAYRNMTPEERAFFSDLNSCLERKNAQPAKKS